MYTLSNKQIEYHTQFSMIYRLTILYWQIRVRPQIQSNPKVRSIQKVSAKYLTHWGRVTHTCVNKLTIIGSENGLAPVLQGCHKQSKCIETYWILYLYHKGQNISPQHFIFVTTLKKLKLCYLYLRKTLYTRYNLATDTILDGSVITFFKYCENTPAKTYLTTIIYYCRVLLHIMDNLNINDDYINNLKSSVFYSHQTFTVGLKNASTHCTAWHPTLIHIAYIFIYINM